MRLYFMRDGHIAAVHIFEPIPASDGEAIKASMRLFEERPEGFEGFELWDRERKIYQHGVELDENAKGTTRRETPR